MKKAKIRVLVVDDSEVIRELIAEMLRGEGDFEVVGQARNGVEAVSFVAQLHPDVITMDVRMPLMNGLDATKAIMLANPTPIVILAGNVHAADMNIAFNAITAGALTVVEKPSGLSADDYGRVRAYLLSSLRLVADVPKQTLRARHGGVGEKVMVAEAVPGLASAAESEAIVRVIGIAASTGGPAVLRELLAGLPSDFCVPIVLVQHITPGFSRGFVNWLASFAPVKIGLAREGDLLGPGQVWLAPEDAHLRILPGGIVHLDDAPPVKGIRPSATPLFESLAQVYGRSGLGIVLSGMGDDGVAGLERMRLADAQIIVQDPTTCVVDSMPQSVLLRNWGVPSMSPRGLLQRLKRLHERQANHPPTPA